MVNKHDLNMELEELRLLFQISVDDIRDAKRKQWTIGYSILLGFSVIIGFYGFINSQLPYTCFDQKLIYYIPLSIMAILINLIGMYHLMDIQHVLSKHRMRYVAIKKSFGEKFQKIIEIADEMKGDAKDYYAYKRYFIWNIQFLFLFAVGIYFVGIMILGDRPIWCVGFFLTAGILNLLFFKIFYVYFIKKCEKAEENLNEIKQSILEQRKKQSDNETSVK